MEFITQEQFDELRNDFILKRAKFQECGARVKMLKQRHEQAKAEKKPLQLEAKEAYVKWLLAQPTAQKLGLNNTSYPRTDEVDVDLETGEIA